jgi:uncharacterized spore protein YtfJ
MTSVERITQMVANHRDALTVSRVYGDPIERDGVIVIPAAVVSGGGGGGGGVDAQGQTGGGTGFGMHARPAGAFVIRDGDVRWEPVEDPIGRLMVLTTSVTVGMLIARSMLRRRRRRHRH